VRLASKLTAALVIGIAAVMAVYGYVQVRREGQLFEAELAKDQRIMGQALAAAMEAIWKRDGQDEALHLAEKANDIEREVRIRWVWLEPDFVAALPAEVAQALAEGQQKMSIRPDETGDDRRYTYTPVTIAGTRVGALELSESLLSQRSYIHTSELEGLVTTLVIVLLCGLIAMGLGVWFVGRPMQLLYQQARRVGAGDLSARLTLRQRDEIGALAAEINTMCDQLSAAVEQLRHADRLKTVGQLASGVAHELGTPLNVVAARAKMIADGEVSGAEISTNARIVAEQAARMTGIIRQLLDFSRRRGPSADLGVGDLHQLADRTLAMLSSLANKRRVAFDLDAEPGALPVQVNENQMQQALTNLILNGIQAMPRGGRLGVVIARRLAEPPTEAGGTPGEYFAISVEDEGSGILPDDLPHVFEPFFTTKDVGEGTGLGLSVAYGIVRDHEGWISVESQVGKGSRFTIFLRPAAPPAAVRGTGT
jgi:two-component system NtrC family sensor kinase